MTPEGKVKAAIKKVLDQYEVYYRMPVTGGYGHGGQLDFYCCYRGRYIGIEAKAGNGKLTALQEQEIERIRTAGGIALVCYSQGEARVGLVCLFETIKAQCGGST